MLGLILGIVTGWLKEFITLGIVFIEALVFMLAFDWLSEIWDIYFYQLNYSLPVSEITYWHSFTILFFAHALGMIISKITPKFISVSNSSNSEQ